MNSIFATDADAKLDITFALGDEADNHDIDGILADAFEYDARLGGFVQTVDEDGFWSAVARHAI